MKRAAATALFSFLLIGVALAQNSGASPTMKGDSGAEQQVKQLEQQIRSQVIKGDSSGLERYEADDCVTIDGSGMMWDKNQSVRMLKDGSVKYTAIDVSEEQIRTYGKTTIYNALANTKLTVKGEDHSGNYRVTIVWANLNGQWKRVSFQSTAVMPHEAK